MLYSIPVDQVVRGISKGYMYRSGCMETTCIYIQLHVHNEMPVTAYSPTARIGRGLGIPHVRRGALYSDNTINYIQRAVWRVGVLVLFLTREARTCALLKICRTTVHDADPADS